MNNIILNNNSYFSITDNNNVSITDNIININGDVDNLFIIQKQDLKDNSLIINIHPNSNVKLFDEYLDCNLEINLMKNAVLTNYSLVNAKTYNKTVNLYDSSNLNSLTFNLSNNDLSNNVNINLLERKAVVNCKTLDISNNNNTHFNKISVVHLAKETEAYCFNYAIGNDSSKLEFFNINKIEEGMSKSISRQKSKGIIMKNSAKVIIEPTLTIFENDVVAAHGATIGKISDEGLFYLMSRGLTKDNALNLIIKGFIDPLIQEVEDKDYQERILNIIKTKI